MDDYFEKIKDKPGLKNARIVSEAHIIPVFGAKEVKSLTEEEIKNWLNDMANSPRRKRSKKNSTEISFHESPKTERELLARRSTANRNLSVFKAALNYALEKKRVENSIAWDSVAPFGDANENTRLVYLLLDEQRKLLDCCSGAFGRLVRGALYTGARYGEITRVVVGDYDSKSGNLKIPKAIDKNRKGRVVSLTDEAWEFFDEICKNREPSEYIFLRDTVERRVRLEVGNAWGKGDQTRLLKKACEDAKITVCSFHELRHTAVSTWLNHGIQIDDVAEQIGDSVATTKKYYAHLCPDARAARIRKSAPRIFPADQ
jgi:integrase